MKKYEIWEGVVILLTVIILLPIWLSRSGTVQFTPLIASILDFLVYPILVVLGVILVRRLRRIIIAMRENKNRPGMF